MLPQSVTERHFSFTIKSTGKWFSLDRGTVAIKEIIEKSKNN